MAVSAEVFDSRVAVLVVTVARLAITVSLAEEGQQYV